MIYWNAYMKNAEFDFACELDRQILLKKDYTIKRLSAKAMELATSDGVYVQYVNTVVFKQIGDTITLNTGGWHTMTSKRWINEYLPSHICLVQHDFNWYLTIKGDRYISGKKSLKARIESGEVVEFTDRMEIKI